jgi:hypothetical protein
MIDLELLAQVWVGGDVGGLERAVVEVERTDRDEVRIGVTVDGEDETTHVYLAPDRAVRLAQALILEASREWRL